MSHIRTIVLYIYEFIFYIQYRLFDYATHLYNALLSINS